MPKASIFEVGKQEIGPASFDTLDIYGLTLNANLALISIVFKARCIAHYFSSSQPISVLPSGYLPNGFPKRENTKNAEYHPVPKIQDSKTSPRPTRTDIGKRSHSHSVWVAEHCPTRLGGAALKKRGSPSSNSKNLADEPHKNNKKRDSLASQWSSRNGKFQFLSSGLGSHLSGSTMDQAPRFNP